MAFAVPIIALLGLYVVWLIYLSACMCIGAIVWGIIMMVKRNRLYDWDLWKRKYMTFTGISLFCFGVIGNVVLIIIVYDTLAPIFR